MKINKIYIPLFIGIILAIGILFGGALDFPMHRTFGKQNSYKSKLNQLIDFIDNEYVDSVDTDSIVDLTLTNILANLDPHSVYVPKAEQIAVAEQMKGNFVGIGVSFYMLRDTVAVIQPVPNGPAQKAGILAGDRILFADNQKLFGKKFPSDSLFSRLKGEQGTSVKLTIYRKSTNKKFAVTLKRDQIPLKSVDVGLMLTPDLGYIKINRFAETTYSEFKEKLIELQKNKLKSLVIDLRGNGGGYLESAVAIADELLPKSQTIVVTKNKKAVIDKETAKAGGLFETGKLYILIDENSASASEILAGAIQDNDRGTIIGRRSFGKGLVQREMDFDDGSAVRLTIARYYTPSGRSIQKPYKNGESEAYFNEFEKRFSDGELYSKDSIKIADTLKFKTKKGRIVYGGGGIVPDVFVPLAVSHGEEAILYILQSGILGQFVFEQIDKNRAKFSKFSIEELRTEIEKNDKYSIDLEKFIAKKGVEISFQKSKKITQNYLLAEFANQLFGEKQYYQILLQTDLMIQKVEGLK